MDLKQLEDICSGLIDGDEEVEEGDMKADEIFSLLKNNISDLRELNAALKEIVSTQKLLIDAQTAHILDLKRQNENLNALYGSSTTNSDHSEGPP